MSDEVQLLGLDFGTTTSSAVVATATLTRSAVTGRMGLRRISERYRSEMVFTPLRDDDRLDEQRVECLLDTWLAAGAVRREALFGGGALLTGLTAQKENAAALVHLVRRRLGDVLVATADDPCLESWLAFMGSCAGLSRAVPRQPILNLDIGGGTTSLALGINGEVLQTGCLFVGARHVQVVPGTYRIVRFSRYARALLDWLGVRKGKGDCLTDVEVQAIVGYYLGLLEAAATGMPEPFQTPLGRLHQQVPFRGPSSRHTPTKMGLAPITDDRCLSHFRRPGRPQIMMSPCADAAHGVCGLLCEHPAAVTFSGGVGELIYAHVQGRPWPPRTHFGDLGIELAQRIVGAPFWSAHLHTWLPASAGRATVYGLLRHSTEVSGSTLFLPHPEVLPLTDVPILGSLNGASTDEHLRDLVDLVRRSARGGCVQVSVGTHSAAAVRACGERFAAVLRQTAFPPQLPLVLLVRENVGKVLGHYVTQWGTVPLNLVVIDEVAVRNAQYVQLGAIRSQVVPVSFYGLSAQGDAP
jgi:ethanolamine utilization protein EutA